MTHEPLSVIQLGNPTLKRVSMTVDTSDDSLQQLQPFFDQLLDTVQASNGVGIAAPQVAQNLRLFIVASRPNLRYPTAPSMEPTVMINPKIVARSDEQVKGWEGCLSVPGIRGLVPRSREIEVTYCDEANAFYDPSKGMISMCIELVPALAKQVTE